MRQSEELAGSLAELCNLDLKGDPLNGILQFLVVYASLIDRSLLTTKDQVNPEMKVV
jgi:hypothetical protein